MWRCNKPEGIIYSGTVCETVRPSSQSSKRQKESTARARIFIDMYVLYSLAFTFVFLHCSAKNNDAASVEAWAMTSK
jgi:hypothetical protein